MQLRHPRAFFMTAAILALTLLVYTGLPIGGSASAQTVDSQAMAGAIGQLARAITELQTTLTIRQTATDARLDANEAAIREVAVAVDRLAKAIEERERNRWPR